MNFLKSLVASALLTTAAHAGASTVQMFPESGDLQPGTTLEFRFPEAVVKTEELGPAAESPVVFTPPLDGTFTWLSTKSGVFTPRGPLPLGGKWQASLRAGIPGGLGATATTPPFGVTKFNERGWGQENVPPDVEVKIAFNLPITADAKFFEFVNGEGVHVPAKVRAITPDDYFEITPEQGDWNMRWKLAADPAAKPDDNAAPSRVVVTPATILPASPGWKLQIQAGLPSADGSSKLAEPYDIALGTVQAFTIRSTEFGNYVNSGPTAYFAFSSSLAPDITSESAAKFFTITPEVAGLSWEMDYNMAIARGKFELGKGYTLHIGEGVASAAGQVFAGDREVAMNFQPVPPRLYLPELTMTQMLGGRRVLPVKSVNLHSIKVRAVLLPPVQALRALSVFSEHEWKYSEGEPVLSDAFSGKAIFEETIALNSPQIDHSVITDLDWTRILGGVKAGFVYLELTGEPLAEVGGKQCAAQALVQLSDLGVLWSKAGDDISAFVFSTRTGKPVSNATAQLFDEKFKPIVKKSGGKDGVIRLAYDTTPRWLIVQSDGDACALSMGPNADTLRTGAWYSDWSVTKDNSPPFRAMTFTDRPIYQPGETVRFKGFLRESSDEGLKIPAAETITVKLLDPESNEITNASVTTDARGSFDGAIVLPPGPLGRYTLSLDGNFPENSQASFIVAAYQPDAFEVDVELPKTFPAGAAAPSAKVAGHYFFGGKISHADVRWSLRYFQTRFAPDGFDSFQFLAADEEDEAKPLTLRGDGKITGGAPMDITPQLPAPSLAPSRGVLTAEVTDINQQTVSHTAEFTREASDFYLGISNDNERAVRLGDEVPIKIIAVRPGGKPVENAVDVKVSITRSRFNVVRELGAGGAMTFRTETIEEPVMEQGAQTITPEFQNGKWIAGEHASMTFKPATLGRHRIRVTARDAGGREVASESSLYVFGKGETVWDYRNPVAVDLVPDKASYKAGDTARILVKTPIDGEAVVNIQRGDTILRTMRLPLSGNAPTLEIPLTVADAPNVYLTLVILRGSDASHRKFPMPEFRFGNCMLEIAQPERVLNVAIQAQKPRVQPGEDVVSTVEVRDHLGKPVANAGVTFYAVDDGVVSLVGFKRPDPSDVFLQPIPNRVLTGLNLASLLPEDPNDLTFGNKGYLIGGGGEDGPVALRQNFPGTACWLPSLITDSDGRVTAQFTAPDALTRYRLVAVAAAGTQAFGSAESSVEISKPLMLLPSLGQFANEGDHLIARAVIRNETGADGAVEVSLRTPDGAQAQSVQVAQGASAAVDFPIAFARPGDIELEWTARMTANGQTFSDGAKTRLPVGSPMLKLRETYFTELSSKANDLLAGVNPQIVEGRGDVSVTVANTRLASLSQSARYLVEYPYGCAEQKASTLVPWIVMPVLGPLMPEFARSSGEIERIKSKTIFELFQLQLPDGGLGFWPGSRESSLFASAWAGIVMSAAAKQGTTLPPQWKSLLDYLSKSLRSDQSADSLQDRVFAAYALALAGKAEPAYHEELYRRRSELPRDARTLLALAIAQGKGPREMVKNLLSLREPAPDDMSPFGGVERERAIRLLAICLLEPKGGEIGALVAEVLQSGLQGKSLTTQNTAWTLLALAAYREKVENAQKGSRNAKGTILAGGESSPFSVSSKTPAVTKVFAMTPGSGASQKLQADNPATAPLYGETAFNVFPPLGEQPRQDRGFSVSRSYRKIADDGSLQPAENLRVGDRVVVTIRVENTRPAHFVAIDDPLPSILEAVNPEFVSKASGESAAERGDSWISHRETRADRVLYFCDMLPAGAHTFEYLARVRVAGQSAAGATRADAMYRPERFGLGTIGHLQSRPASAP